MKNLHLEATEEKTLLVLREVDNKLVLHTPITQWHGVNQYVHITSDEEVKAWDWTLHYYDGKPVVSKASQKVIDGGYKREDYKKIILTTHPLLIADRVQTIDEDFLKWLIKNPNCNFVEWDKNYNRGNGKTYYKIHDLKQVVMPLDNENIPEEYYDEDSKDFEIASLVDFIEGAKWQTDRMYSEEEVKAMIEKALTHNDYNLCGSLVTAQGEIRTANFGVWFEEFKKK